MYARYQYNSGVQATVQANILADLLAILTGEVNVSNLSASCDKVNTTITVDNPAGWVLHDAAAGTNAKAIKAPLADDQATFKHLVLDTCQDPADCIPVSRTNRAFFPATVSVPG